MVTSDLWEEASSSATWTWYDWQGNALNQTTMTFAVPLLNNSVLYSAQGLANFLTHGTNATDVWMHLNVTAGASNPTTINEQVVRILSFLFLPSRYLIEDCSIVCSGFAGFFDATRP